MLTKNEVQTLHIVNDHFQPYEAQEIIEDLIDHRTQLHKIQMLRRWERNHHFNSQPFDDQIHHMQRQSMELSNLIAQAQRMGLEVEVKACIEVKVVNKLLQPTAN